MKAAARQRSVSSTARLAAIRPQDRLRHPVDAPKTMDLGLEVRGSGGAGDGNRTRTVSLGIALNRTRARAFSQVATKMSSRVVSTVDRPRLVLTAASGTHRAHRNTRIVLTVAGNQSRFDDQYAELMSTLDEVTGLLRDVGEESWLSWLRLRMAEMKCRDISGLDRLLRSYGGMGSFNDLVIHPINGHRIDADDLNAVNDRLVQLRQRCWELARDIRHLLPP